MEKQREINEIILHCTATQEGKDYTVEQIRKWHTDPVEKGGRGWSDIGYHFIIYRDGTVAEGRDVNKIGAHCKDRNAHSIGIVYVGGIDHKGKAKDTRTEAQKDSLIDLVYLLMEHYNIPIENVHCHNEFANKACPSFKIETFLEEMKESKLIE